MYVCKGEKEKEPSFDYILKRKRFGYITELVIYVSKGIEIHTENTYNEEIFG